MDPKLVAAAFGMDPQGVLIYLADHVDAGRLPGTRGSFSCHLAQVHANMCALAKLLFDVRMMEPRS